MLPYLRPELSKRSEHLDKTYYEMGLSTVKQHKNDCGIRIGFLKCTKTFRKSEMEPWKKSTQIWQVHMRQRVALLKKQCYKVSSETMERKFYEENSVHSNDISI